MRQVDPFLQCFIECAVHNSLLFIIIKLPHLFQALSPYCALFLQLLRGKYFPHLLNYFKLSKMIFLNIIYSIKKMGIVSQKIGSAFQTCDCFSAPILLRYQTDDKKSTKAGGVLSVGLIIVLVIAFYQSWLTVFNKKQIKSEYTVMREMDPTSASISNDDFVFSVALAMFNLSDPDRFFDVEVTQEIRQNGAGSSSIAIQMQPCQKSAFIREEGDFGNVYDRLWMNTSHCFPQDFEGKIGGKWSSESFEYLRIHIKRCDTSSAGCKSDIDFQNYLLANGAFYANFYFLNRLINPADLDPISTYFEDKNYNMINDEIAIDTNIYISEYQIITDESLWPWIEQNITKGFFIDRTQKEEFVYPSKNGSYAQFHFRKSDQKIQIKRQFRKIDELLSYIGGLFGIIAFFFGYLMINYSQCCFELEMCNKVFKDEHNAKSEKSSQNSDDLPEGFKKQLQGEEQVVEQKDIGFNFLTYLKYLVSVVVFAICPKFKWKSMQKLNERLEQTRNQMNIDTLLSKISLYQKSFQCLFDDDQIVLLYLQQKLSIKQLKEQRMIMNLEQQQNCHQESNDNKVANDFLNISSVRGSLCPLDTTFYRRSKINSVRLTNNNPSFINNFINQNKQIRDQIKKALKNVGKKAEEGNDVCQRILEGVRQDVLSKYKNWMGRKLMRKSKIKNLPKVQSAYQKDSVQDKSSQNQAIQQDLQLKVKISHCRRESQVSNFFVDGAESNGSLS